MIWVLVLFILLLPQVPPPSVAASYLLFVTLWFLGRMVYMGWRKSKHEAFQLPSIRWTLFAFAVLALGTFASSGSLSPPLTLSAFEILVANVLVLVTLCTFRRHPGISVGVVLGCLGLLGTWVSEAHFPRLHEGRIAPLFGALAQQFGLCALLFAPSVLTTLLFSLQKARPIAPAEDRNVSRVGVHADTGSRVGVPADTGSRVGVPADTGSRVGVPADTGSGVGVPADTGSGVGVPADTGSRVGVPADTGGRVGVPADWDVGTEAHATGFRD